MKKLTALKATILIFLSLFLIFGSLPKQALAVGAVCTEPVPLDIVIIIDRSGSMGASESGGHERIYYAKLAADNLVDSLTSTGDSLLPHRIALITFDGDAAEPVNLALNAVTTANDVKLAIDAIPTGGTTYIGPALTAATDQLTTLGRPNAKKVVILLTDGRNWGNSDEETATRRANTITQIPALQAAADTIYSIGIGTEGGAVGTDSELDKPLLQQIAKGPPGRYINVSMASELLDIFQGIITVELANISCPATPTAALPATGIQGTSRSSGYDFTMLILLTTSLALFNLWRYRKLKIQR
jgi:Mg-chelatase subunit ChlD